MLRWTCAYESYFQQDGLTKIYSAPETPFDVRSHFCPMKLFFSLFTVEALRVIWQKSEVIEILRKDLSPFQNMPTEAILYPQTNIIVLGTFLAQTVFVKLV